VTARTDVTIRRALQTEADDIARLNNYFAGQAKMLHRSPEMIAIAIDDYVVAVDGRSRIVGIGALKEYSPSIAEVAAIAVSPAAQGLGLGRRIVDAVEALARKRGVPEVFALTLEPQFFEALGYQRVDRARYPEKIRRDCIGCARRFACNETCFAKPLRDSVAEPWEAAA
jgi:N-acetylglutamate synthase-like GNAT family acetyltransferase